MRTHSCRFTGRGNRCSAPQLHPRCGVRRGRAAEPRRREPTGHSRRRPTAGSFGDVGRSPGAGRRSPSWPCGSSTATAKSAGDSKKFRASTGGATMPAPAGAARLASDPSRMEESGWRRTGSPFCEARSGIWAGSATARSIRVPSSAGPREISSKDPRRPRARAAGCVSSRVAPPSPPSSMAGRSSSARRGVPRGRSTPGCASIRSRSGRAGTSRRRAWLLAVRRFWRPRRDGVGLLARDVGEAGSEFRRFRRTFRTSLRFAEAMRDRAFREGPGPLDAERIAGAFSDGAEDEAPAPRPPAFEFRPDPSMAESNGEREETPRPVAPGRGCGRLRAGSGG